MGTYASLLQQSAPKPSADRTVERSNERTYPNQQTVFQKTQIPNDRSVESKKPAPKKIKPEAPQLVTTPSKRSTRRHSFEFYDDQIQQLHKMRAQAGMRGEQLILSDVVRRALDLYFKEHVPANGV